MNVDELQSYYVGREGPLQDPTEKPYRVAYSDQIPTPGYTYYPAESFEEAARIARALADRDNAPGSGVEANLIFVQRWDPQDEYDHWSSDTGAPDYEDLDDMVWG